MKIFVVPIEPLHTRYTSQWHKHFPELLKQYAKDNNSPASVFVIDGKDVPNIPQPGAFLDFAATNIYKSSQIERLSKFFQDGHVHDGDHIIFLDAWHPGITQIKYMKDLLNIDVKLSGLWHAGNYDKNDFLGRLVKDNRWVNNLEKSIFHCLDYNFFATDAHIAMFVENVFGDNLAYEVTGNEIRNKIVRTGWPMEYMADTLIPHKKITKENIVLFPHRLAPEKQVDIFYDLAKSLPQYQFIACQEKQLTKLEYHELLSKSKVVFSCSLQETLGISVCAEGPLSNCIPFAPDRLSYSEVFNGWDEFLYPSEWTESFNSYKKNKISIIKELQTLMEKFVIFEEDIEKYNMARLPKYFSFDVGLKTIFGK